MRVVLDTSVLVAAARSRPGASFALLSSIPAPEFQICLSVGLYTEWQAVLTRPEHLPPGQSAEDVRRFLRYLASQAHLQEIHFLCASEFDGPTPAASITAHASHAPPCRVHLGRAVLPQCAQLLRPPDSRRGDRTRPHRTGAQ